MPTYAYRCENDHEFELFHSIKDDTPKSCPTCGAPARRVPAGGAGLLFKGTGFHITDYRSRSYQERARSEQGSGEAGGKSAPPAPSGGDAKPGAAASKPPGSPAKPASGGPGSGSSDG